MYGLTEDDLDEAAVEVWPENLPAVNAFIAMSTQWRVGGFGATGLDYNAAPPVFRFIQIPEEEWPDTFDGVRTMEAEALKIMGEKRNG